MTPQNKKFFGRLTEEERALGQLLRPSWLSGLLVSLTSLIVVVGTIAAIQFKISDFQYLYQLQSDNKTHAVTNNYQTINSGVTGNVFISDLPLMILWGGVGLIVYWCTMSILRAVKNVSDIEMELEYVHADRNDIIHQTIGTLLVRVLSLLVWFLYLQATIHLIVPYAIAIAYAAVGSMSILYGAGYVLWGMVLLILALHLHVVLARLLFLRPRLFGNG